MSNELVTVEKDNDFSFSSPTNFEQAMYIAKIISRSDLAPKDFRGKPENVLVAIEMGKDLGLKPMQAIQNIAVINGRPCIWGDAALAVLQSHRDFEYIDESVDNGVATCKIKRKGNPEVVRTFSESDAKKAGLFGKSGPWTTYPKRMLQLRARGFAARDSFADALKGINFREEVEDYATKKIKDSNAKKALSALTVEKEEEVEVEVVENSELVIDNVDLETGEILNHESDVDKSTVDIIDYDDGKAEDIQTLEQMLADNKISLDTMIDYFKKAGVDCITDLKHVTIKALINKYS